jgi:predicted permease
METLLQDLKYAARTLLKAPGFTFVAALTLALGIGANTAIFSVLYGVLLRPLPYPQSDRMVGFADAWRGNRGERDVTFREFRFLADNSTVFEQLAVETEIGLNVFSGGEARRVRGLRVSSGYFDAMGTAPAIGRPFAADEDQVGGANVAILSHGFWRERFGGDTGVVGRTISLDGAPYTVVGVMPKGFVPLAEADVWSTVGQVSRTIGSGQNLHVIGRLKRGLSVTAAQAALDVPLAEWRRQFEPRLPADMRLTVFPLRELVSLDLATQVRVLFGAIGFVLLIACANVANLVLGRAATRGRELAVRVAVGATRGRLVRQLLTESVVLALLGGALGLVLAEWGLGVLLSLVPQWMVRAYDIRLDAAALVFTAAASLLVGVGFGLVPAWHAARSDLFGALKEAAGRATQNARAARLRGALVVAEVALSLILLAGAGLLVQAMVRLLRTDPGFDHHNVIAAEIWLTGSRYDSTAAIAGYYERIRAQLEATPGVRAAAVVEAGIPLVRGGNMGVAVDGIELQQTTNYRTVTPTYFATLGIPVLRGRVFAASDVESSEPVAIVSESFARRFMKGDGLGGMIRVGGPRAASRRVVGIVGDVRQFVGFPALPTYYLASAQTDAGLTRGFSSWFPITIVARTNGDAAAMKPLVIRGIRAVDAQVPMGQVQTMDEILSGSLVMQRFEMLLLGVFAGLAVVLAAVGIYGVMSNLVAQRTHEIGVRMALGAVPREVLGLVLGRGMLLAGAGALIGLVGALGLTRLLTSQLYGFRPNDPLTMGAVTALLLTVAFLACVIPARRATRVDPLVALRSE